MIASILKKVAAKQFWTKLCIIWIEVGLCNELAVYFLGS